MMGKTVAERSRNVASQLSANKPRSPGFSMGPFLTLPTLGRKWRPLAVGALCRAPRGAVAQLGERLVRNEEVSGSIPLGSTNLRGNRRFTGKPSLHESCPPATRRRRLFAHCG